MARGRVARQLGWEMSGGRPCHTVRWAAQAVRACACVRACVRVCVFACACACACVYVCCVGERAYVRAGALRGWSRRNHGVGGGSGRRRVAGGLGDVQSPAKARSHHSSTLRRNPRQQDGRDSWPGLNSAAAAAALGPGIPSPPPPSPPTSGWVACRLAGGMVSCLGCAEGRRVMDPVGRMC